MARKLLVEAHRANPSALTVLMAWLTEPASHDLGLGTPAALFRRFVGWTLSPATRCRVCSSRAHDVLPGLPPRLFPCNKLHGRESP